MLARGGLCETHKHIRVPGYLAFWLFAAATSRIIIICERRCCRQEVAVENMLKQVARRTQGRMVQGALDWFGWATLSYPVDGRRSGGPVCLCLSAEV